MDNTASRLTFYEEEKVIDDAEHIVFECARWQSYLSVLSSIFEAMTAANIVGVISTSMENWDSVANYVERILRLKKRDLEAAEHAGVPASMILEHMPNRIRLLDVSSTFNTQFGRNKDQRAKKGSTQFQSGHNKSMRRGHLDVSSTFDTQFGRMLGQMDYTRKQYHRSFGVDTRGRLTE